MHNRSFKRHHSSASFIRLPSLMTSCLCVPLIRSRPRNYKKRVCCGASVYVSTYEIQVTPIRVVSYLLKKCLFYIISFKCVFKVVCIFGDYSCHVKNDQGQNESVASCINQSFQSFRRSRVSSMEPFFCSMFR